MVPCRPLTTPCSMLGQMRSACSAARPLGPLGAPARLKVCTAARAEWGLTARNVSQAPAWHPAVMPSRTCARPGLLEIARRPSRQQRLPAPCAVPLFDFEWNALSGTLFTAAFTWGATLLVIQVWKILFDESFTPLNVVKVQVGVQGPANSLRKELQAVCNGFGGSGPSSWLLMEQSVAQLKQNFDRCLIGNVEVKTTKSFRTAQQEFNQLSEREGQLLRAEAEQCYVDDAPDIRTPPAWQRLVAASPLGSVWGGEAAAEGATAQQAADEVMVVTLLVVTNRQVQVAGDGHSRSDVLSVLGQLSGLANDNILGAQVLWVPDEQGCYISKAQLLQDVPSLSALT